MDKLLNDIKERIEKETRATTELYKELKVVGSIMYFKDILNRDMVICMCSDLIKVFERLTKQ